MSSNKKTPLSFGYLMMRHMNECAHRNKGGSLSYALFLTRFFEYFDVDLENEPPKMSLPLSKEGQEKPMTRRKME